MKHSAKWAKAIVPVLAAGGVGVMPTDTIYGIVGSALCRATVERIYRLRRRNPKKPMIILIGSVADVVKFGVTLDGRAKKVLKKVWPGKVSVILPIVPGNGVAMRKFKYLHRGMKTLAFRLPKEAWLRAILHRTGPLVAPSANFEGEPSAATVRVVKRYFGDRVEFYVDDGPRAARPSTLVALRSEGFVVLRQGETTVK